MTTTNLGSETEALLQRVAEVAKSATPQANMSVLHVWRAALLIDGSNTAEFLRSLAVVISRLALLDEQISQSKIMNENQKRVAHSVISGIKLFTQIDVMHRNITDFTGNISQDKLAILGMFSISIRLENSELTLSNEDAMQIAEQIDELGLLVSNANIEPALKKLLLHHVSYMGWAVRNISIVGTEGIYEAFGPAVLTAGQVARSKSQDQNNPDEAPRKHIYQQVMEIVRKTIKLLQVSDKTLQLISHVSDDIQGLLP